MAELDISQGELPLSLPLLFLLQSDGTVLPLYVLEPGHCVKGSPRKVRERWRP